MYGRALDVIITRDASSIFQGTSVILDPYLYDDNGSQYVDPFRIVMTLDCSKLRNRRKEITFRSFLDSLYHTPSMICHHL